jgi:hypothetical protein
MRFRGLYKASNLFQRGTDRVDAVEVERQAIWEQTVIG